MTTHREEGALFSPVRFLSRKGEWEGTGREREGNGKGTGGGNVGMGGVTGTVPPFNKNS